MQIVPLQTTPNQTLNVLLGGQSCQINVWTLMDGLTYLDLIVGNSTPILSMQICQDKNLLVRYPYAGFIGDMWFFDTQGSSDPVYTGFGDRYQLQYITPADFVTAGVNEFA